MFGVTGMSSILLIMLFISGMATVIFSFIFLMMFIGG